MPLTIGYVGVPLAGRGTSLARALAETGRRARWDWADAHLPHTLTLDGTPLVARLAWVRGRPYWEDPDNPSPEGLAELAWLTKVDGLLFVADAQHERLEANEDHLASLDRDFRRRGIHIDHVPLVFAANKRDLVEPWEMSLLRERLVTRRSTFVETCALTGHGLLDALRSLLAMMREDVARGG